MSYTLNKRIKFKRFWNEDFLSNNGSIEELFEWENMGNYHEKEINEGTNMDDSDEEESIDYTMNFTMREEMEQSEESDGEGSSNEDENEEMMFRSIGEILGEKEEGEFLMNKKIGEMSEEEINRSISAHLKRKDFPILIEEDINKIIDYYRDKEEHPFLNWVNLRKVYCYQSKIKFDHYSKFPFEKNSAGDLLKKILFFSERSLTKSFSTRYSTPFKIYYCANQKHPVEDSRNEKSARFLFYELPFCDCCAVPISISNYILKFDLRELIEFKLVSLSIWTQ